MALGAACSSSVSERSDPPDGDRADRRDGKTAPSGQKSKTIAAKPPVSTASKEENPSKGESKPTKEECYAVDTGDKFLLKSQTFPIDFEPFRNSCFVTSHDPEYDDPPLGSEISVYTNGKRVYKFDSRYNPNAATCWVKAVSFQDVTDDRLVDVIVIGQCGAKSGPIQGNEVFINTGTAFYTNVEANDSLEEFTTIKDVANFVRKNKKLFEK